MPAADLTLALLLTIAGGVGAYCGSRGLDALLVRGETFDVWFEGDCPRVFENLSDSTSIHSRSAVHPLFALAAYPPVAVLRWGGLEPIVAVRLLRALAAAACLAAFYGLLRIGGCRRLDSALFSAAAATSAATMFWFVVPETYPFGLLSILLALGLVALSEDRRVSPVWDVLVNLATFGVTVTNWMAGLCATFVRWPMRKAVILVLVAGCLALALMAVQNQFFRSAALLPISLEEKDYVLHADAGGPGRVLASFVFHSMVMPDIGTVARHKSLPGPLMTVQHSWPGSAGPFGVAGAVLWAVLLSLGIYGMCTCHKHRRLRVVLSLTIAGQLGLHLMYGLETFTYACHFGPLLVLVAAFATLSRVRRIAIALTVGLIICTGINNVGQFMHARTFVQQWPDTSQSPLAFQSEPGAPATGPYAVGEHRHHEPLSPDP